MDLENLQTACADRLTMGLEPIELAGSSQWLAQNYSISFAAMGDDIFSLAELQGVSPRSVAMMRGLCEARSEAHASSKREFSRLSKQFYNAIAVDPWQGLFHSQKWTLILETAAYAMTVCRAGRLEGAILDVGCHTGYHTAWLARQTGASVYGLDESTAAIAYARGRAASLGLSGAHFKSELDRHTPKFDFILGSDGPVSVSGNSIAPWSRHLAPTGVLMVVEEGGLPPSAIAKSIASSGLHLLHADVVGGWMCGEYIPRTVYLLSSAVCGTDPVAILRHADAAWDDGFRNHCNSGLTPPEEQMLGWYRARTREKRSKS